MNGRNRFQDFFEEDKYVVLKNYLYNYRLRKRAIEQIVAREDVDCILEIGSGISPVVTTTDRIVYSELSPLASATLKRIHGKGAFAAADCTRLPFADGAFSHGIGSEVFEHLPDDQAALNELARVIRPGGKIIVTFPHRRFYFANDDRFVHHFRRYELDDMMQRLTMAGFRPIHTQKVLGPLEKAAMMTTVACVAWLQGGEQAKSPTVPGSRWLRVMAPVFDWANRAFACLAWIDARIMPRALAAVVLIIAEKPGAAK